VTQNLVLPKNFLRLDTNSIAFFSSIENGLEDFSATKAREFLKIQSSFPRLDHNSLLSDAEKA